MLHKSVRWGTVESKYFSNSSRIPSTPADLPFFNCLIASITSLSEIGPTLIGSWTLAWVSSMSSVVVGSAQLSTAWKLSFHLFTSSSCDLANLPSAILICWLCIRCPVSSFMILYNDLWSPLLAASSTSLAFESYHCRLSLAQRLLTSLSLDLYAHYKLCRSLSFVDLETSFLVVAKLKMKWKQRKGTAKKTQAFDVAKLKQPDVAAALDVEVYNRLAILESVDVEDTWSQFKTTVVEAARSNGLQELMNNLNRVTREFGMRINTRNTKVMCISRKGKSRVKIFIDGQQIEQVSQFKYLGSTISNDGYCHKEIKSRIAMA